MNKLDIFLNPRSVAVIGASDRPGSWGSFIMEGLLSKNSHGRIYPVNLHGEQIYNLPIVKDVREIKQEVDLAILVVPEQAVEEAIKSCGEKGVKGLTIITAGFSEVFESAEHKQKEEYLCNLARSFGMRLLGPNVSGTFNLHAGFNASAAYVDNLLPTPIAAICQGGFAFYDLLASGFHRKMGVGKFVHTGNEADLTVTDFLEEFGNDPQVEIIVMYIETIRQGKRFLEVAADLTKRKPIIVYKAGRTPGSARAARSHTGALSGQPEIVKGLFNQAGIVSSPSMELLLPLGHALQEHPPLKGKKVAIITVGGSWGVALSDALEEAGLQVPALSSKLQQSLRALNIPQRASTRNPVDIGAAGPIFPGEIVREIAREILVSGEVDALILHGLGRPGRLEAEAPAAKKLFLEHCKKTTLAVISLEKELNLPIFVGNHYTPWESQVVWDLNKQGIRIYNRMDEIAQLLFLMYDYNQKVVR